MSAYGSIELARYLSQLKYLNITEADALEVIANIGYQVLDSLATGQSIELPFWARFGVSKDGNPTGYLTSYFLKNYQARFTTNCAQLGDSQVVKQFYYSGASLLRLVVPHMFAELSNVVLYRSCDVDLDFGGVFRFYLRRRLRRWGFKFSEYAVQYAQQNGHVSRSKSALPYAHADNARSQASSRRAPLSRASSVASSQRYKSTCSRALSAASSNRQLYPAGNSGCDVANLADFTEMETTAKRCLDRSLYDINIKHPPLFTRRIAEKARHQLDYTDSGYVQKLENELAETMATLRAKQVYEREQQLERTRNQPPKQCIACIYDNDIESKKARRVAEKAVDQYLYNKWANDTATQQVYREIEHSAHYHDVQRQNYDYNAEQAENLYYTRKEYMATGRLAPEGVLVENGAVLADPEGLRETMRARAKSYLNGQLIQSKQKYIEALNIEYRREDYINRKHNEMLNKYQEADERAWQREKQQSVLRLMYEQEQFPKIDVIPRVLDMTCCMEDSYRRNARYDELFHADNIVRSDDNKATAELQRTQKQLDKLGETLSDKEHQVGLQRKLFLENMRRQQQLEATRADLSKTYDEDITRKAEKARRDRIAGWQNMDEYRFYDRPAAVESCSCCKHTRAAALPLEMTV